MLRSKKLWTMLSVALLAVGCLWMTPSKATGAGGAKGVTCTIDMIVETTSTSSTGTTSSVQTTYQKQFTLLQGETLSDDFSSPLRFRFFDAGLTKVNDEWTMAVDWFADTTTFNSVDLTTAVVIPKGAKKAKSVGTHNFYTSGQQTQTSYSIVCVAN